MLGIWIGIAIIAGLVVLAFIKANLRICHPNEILVFSGKKRRLKDGTELGYRIIKGGRGLKIPIVESVSRMPLNTIPIDLELTGALTKGIIPINIQAMANVKIAGSEEGGLSNALERFLGKNITDISQVAKENIEGSLRGVLATLTPEEANSNRLEFGEKVGEEAMEVVLAAKGQGDERLVSEIADLTYHLLVLLAARGLDLADVQAELAKRRR